MQSKQMETPTCKENWFKKYGIDFTESKWKTIFTLAKSVSCNTKLIEFQYKIIRTLAPLCRNKIRGGILGKWRDATPTPRSFPMSIVVVHTRDRCPDDYCCFSSSIPRPAELSNFPHANFHWLPTPKQYFPHKNKTDIGFLLWFWKKNHITMLPNNATVLPCSALAFFSLIFHLELYNLSQWFTN